jgi:hypothetical protein
MDRRKPLKRTPFKRATPMKQATVSPLKRAGPIKSKPKQSPQPITQPPLSDRQWWQAADGQRAKLLVDRVCRVCENDAHSFHHTPPRSWGGLNVADAGGPVCGDGTTGCHGKVEAMDEAARREYGKRMKPDEIAYVLWLLGEARGRHFLRERYFRDVPALFAVWRGAEFYRRPKVVYDDPAR